jgi:hypothetical protein
MISGNLQKNQKGFLMIEFIIGAGIFVASAAAFSFLIFQYQSLAAQDALRVHALLLAEKQLSQTKVMLADNFNYTPLDDHSFIDGYTVVLTISDIDNFTKSIKVTVSYGYRGKYFSTYLNATVTDPKNGEGQSSCRPSQDPSVWNYPSVMSFDLMSLGIPVMPTDVDLVGSYLYISSNTATSSDPDLFIFDVTDIHHPFLVSTLNTGPGLLSIRVAGNILYGGNSSISAQLQIIDISDRKFPHLITSFKLPGTYKDATTIGNSLFYKEGKIFLGTQKSQTAEFHVIDVSSPTSPRELDSYEIGAAINDIFAFGDTVYIASAKNDEELRSFKVSNQGTLSPQFSYDAPGGSGNGKRVSVFLNKLYLGRTQTIQDEELDRLDISHASSSVYSEASSSLKASVQGIIPYGNFVFTLLNQPSDSFRIFDNANSTLLKLNTSPIILPAHPLDFDCDVDTFAIIYQESPIISFITHS